MSAIFYPPPTTPLLRAVFALVLLCGLAACSAKRPANELRIGMELAYPPFEMTDAQGEPTGVSVDLAQSLGEYLHRPVAIQNIPFDGLIPSLKTGKIDLIISSLTATPVRRESIDFSEPYLTTGLALLVPIRSNVQSVRDLEAPGRIVAVKKGTTGVLYATEKLPQARLLVLDKESACVLEVAQGKADAFIFDQLSVWQNSTRQADKTRGLLQPFTTEPWAVGLRKGDDALRTQVNAFLTDFRAQGGFTRLGEKWLKEQRTAFEQQGIPFVF